MSNVAPGIPKLRFPKFSGKWEQRHLGDYFEFKNGVNADKSAYGRGHKFINVLDIIADGAIYHDKIIGSVEISDAEFQKNEVKYGDVLFQRSSETREEVGQSNVYLDKTKSATFGGFVIRGRSKATINPEFFNNLLKTSAVRRDMTARSGGSTRFNVGQVSLSKVEVVISVDPDEQQKIARFLGSVDEKISQLTCKKTLLEDYKKGCMQKLFSQKLRFKDDDENAFPEWAEKKLGDVFEEVKKRVGNQKLPTFSISAGIGWVSQVEKFGRDISGQQNKKYTVLGVGEFSYNKGNSKSYAFGCIYPNSTGEKIAVPSVFISFKRRAETTSIGYYAKLFEGHYLDRGLRTLISSGARMDGLLNVNKNDFFDLEIPHPNLDEQQKIADFLTAIDKKIELVSTEIEHAKAFKKGLLQQMFI